MLKHLHSIIGAIIIAAAILFVFRWEIATAGADRDSVLILNRWTGTVTVCSFGLSKTECSEERDGG